MCIHRYHHYLNVTLFQYPQAQRCHVLQSGQCSYHLLVLDVSWMLLVPVHDTPNIGLDHTDSSLCSSLRLNKAAQQHTQSQPHADEEVI